jgi:hypothetical protein
VGAEFARRKVLKWAKDRTQLFTPPAAETATVSGVQMHVPIQLTLRLCLLLVYKKNYICGPLQT